MGGKLYKTPLCRRADGNVLDALSHLRRVNVPSKKIRVKSNTSIGCFNACSGLEGNGIRLLAYFVRYARIMLL
jgi:hypothetical protein